MAIKRSKRMEVVLTLAKRAEDDVAKQLGQVQQEVSQGEDQLRQLQDYNEAYKQEIQAKTQGLSGQDMINSRSFLQRLGSAEQEQQGRITQMRAVQDSVRQQWQLKHHYRKSINDLIERIRTSENLAEEKRLQIQLDELATQLYLRNQA